MAESISGKIVRNTIYNAFGYAGGAIVTMALTPYLVGSLGDQAYGVLVVVGILGGYFGLLDFGINTSFVKYIAGYSAGAGHDGINRVVNTGLAFYLLFSAAAVTAGFALAAPAAELMRVSPALLPDAVFSIRAGFLIFAVASSLAPLAALQRGLQRMDVSNKVSVAMALLNAAGVVAVLKGGLGLKGVIAVYLLMALVRGAADILISFRIFPGLRIGSSYVDKATFYKLFVFGYKLQVTRISSMISAHFDKLLIAAFLSAGLVTAYQVGSMVAVYAVSALTLLTGALMPAFSELLSAGDRSKVLVGYRSGTKYIGLLAAPLFSFLTFSAPQLMLAWMGEGHGQAALALRVLAAGWFINTVLGGVGGAFVQAMDKPQIQMRGAIVNIILNPLLSVLLLKFFGFPGVLAGTSLSIALSALYFTWDLHREFNMPLRGVLASSLLVPTSAAAACGAAAYLLSERIPGLSGLALQFSLFCSFYLLTMYGLKPLAAADADRIFGAVGALRRFAGNFSAGRTA